MNDALLAVEGPLTFRYTLPEPVSSTRRILLLLHGWTGDENIMWIFVRQPPADTLVLSPRGLIKADPSGYGWINHTQGLDTPLDVYLPAARELLARMDNWLGNIGLAHPTFDVMGFSQGAAMAGVLATRFPERIGKTAMLAGFLPAGPTEQPKSDQLKGKKFFIAHGTKDDTIPFSKAEETVAALSSLGADVTFCPSDTTHKISLDCTKGLDEFFGMK